jgi:peptidoglycan/xylan/chitin deacetylase (PgdA/CDA1 family)
MATRVLLTIDTELTWRHYAAGATWQESFARCYEAAGVGVPYQLDVLARHGLKACFFVDPMPALVYGMEPVRRMVAPILAAGQEVQLHLHSFWADLAEGMADGCRFELTSFGLDRQRELIATARDLLMLARVPRPIAFRAGSYAANRATLAALSDLGMIYDSSHNGAEHPWPSALPFDPRQIAPAEREGIIEVPVTTIEDAPGKLRHLQLCAVSIRELREALLHAGTEGHELVTIVSHSFELATRDGSRANEVLRRRFESVCAFLADHADRLPTAHFADLRGLRVGGDAEPLPPRALRRAQRMMEQLWANAVHERQL